MTSRSSTSVSSPVELTALRHPLSASEINALIRVGSGLANFLPSDHRMQLASLGLITVNSRGRLVLTQGGKEQLAEREVRAKHDSGRRLR
jgi:hypothetical protein